jgi:epoxyqueuosine reductase
MNKTQMIQGILEQADACGFADCGIIPVTDMAGYADMLDLRFSRFPDQAEYGRKYYDFAYPAKQYPWS